MATTSKDAIIVEGGLPTVNEIDSDLWGQGTLASRPATGANVGDIYLLVDSGNNKIAFQRWNGSVWENLQGDPVNANGGGAQGDILYRNASQWVVLSAGTQYQFLQTQGSGANPAYSAYKIYPASATNPASPAPAAGDMYYNTSLGMWMFYDGTRTKWLSIDTAQMHFGGKGNTAAGAYYTQQAAFSYSSTNGRRAEYNGTIVALSYTRDDTDAATFEAVADGTGIATLASTALSGSDVTLNADFTAGQILGARNQTGGNTVSNAMGWITFRWRV